jgi:hypothetical protein
MRFHEIVKEDSHTEYFEKCKIFWSFWKRARKECSDFIRMRGLLYRGFRSEHPPIFKGQSVERMPEKGERRDEVDAWLSSHGFTALRGNSVFAANTPEQAKVYATHGMYTILPCNGFQYTWYRDSHDLYQKNFNDTLGRKDLSMEELMTSAQPMHDDLQAMMKTPRLHEMHFIGSYWAFDYYQFAQMVIDEIHGQGLMNQKRWGRIDAETAAYIGLTG